MDDLDTILSRLTSSISEIAEAQAEYSKAVGNCEDSPDYFCRGQIDRAERAQAAFRQDFVDAVKAVMELGE